MATQKSERAFDLHTRIKWLADVKFPDGSIPFAALRIISHSQECSEYGRAVKHDHAPSALCQGYRLEPDREKACWRVWERLAIETWDKDWHLMLAHSVDMKKALLRAAEAWAREKAKG